MEVTKIAEKIYFEYRLNMELQIISFYQKQKILDEDDIGVLRVIQSNRNGIHVYMGRSMGTWMDLQNAIRHMGAILELLTLKLPVAIGELEE